MPPANADGAITITPSPFEIRIHRQRPRWPAVGTLRKKTKKKDPWLARVRCGHALLLAADLGIGQHRSVFFKTPFFRVRTVDAWGKGRCGISEKSILPYLNIADGVLWRAGQDALMLTKIR